MTRRVPPRAPRVAWEGRSAPFWRRSLAGLSDLLLCLGGTLLLGSLAGLPLRELLASSPLPPLDWFADRVLGSLPELLRWTLLGGGVVAAYFTVFPPLFARTPGGWLWGLQLAGPDLQPLRPGRALGRTLLLLLTVPPGGLGFWWAAADRQRRALYDRLSGSFLLVGPPWPAAPPPPAGP